MEMNLFQRNAVGFGFCLSQYAKDTLCDCFRLPCHCAIVYDMQDFLHSTVLMASFMTMAMYRSMSVQILHIMIVVFMGAVQNHREVAGIKPGFLYPADFDPEAFQRQALKCIL